MGEDEGDDRDDRFRATRRACGEQLPVYARRRREDQCTARICHPADDCDNTINSTMSDPCGLAVLPGVNVVATRYAAVPTTVTFVVVRLPLAPREAFISAPRG